MIRKDWRRVWSWNESQESRINMLPTMCLVLSHVRHWWNTAASWGWDILWWNLLWDACLFDWASYRLWYVDSTAGYCILQIACVLFSFLFHICLFRSMSIMWEASHPSRVPQSTLYFLTLFCLCFLLPGLAAFPQTWHKKKNKGLLNHFSELKTKRGADALLPGSIWIDATRHCCKIVPVEVADLSAFDHNISSAHHIQPVCFSLKWQIIASTPAHSVPSPTFTGTCSCIHA